MCVQMQIFFFFHHRKKKTKKKTNSFLFHTEKTNNNNGDMELCEVKLCCWGLPSAASSSLSPQCRRSVSQGQGSFQSPGAHPSEPPAKLLLSLLHPLSCSALFLCSHFFSSSCSALSFTWATLRLPSLAPAFPSATPLSAFTLLSVFPLLLFLSQRSSSSAAVHN